jgi:hypothetical protein
MQTPSGTLSTPFPKYGDIRVTPCAGSVGPASLPAKIDDRHGGRSYRKTLQRRVPDTLEYVTELGKQSTKKSR